MTTPGCGGCQGLGAHTRACRDPLGMIAVLIEDVGDSIGGNNPMLANRAYRQAQAIRDYQNKEQNMGTSLEAVMREAAGETRNENLTEVIDERVKVYGDPTKTFPQIAEVWSGIIGHKVQPAEVPLMLMGMKLVRAAQAPDYSDNTDDVEGYLDIFRQVVGEDMIHARSVTEYIEKKKTRRG